MFDYSVTFASPDARTKWEDFAKMFSDYYLVGDIIEEYDDTGLLVAFGIPGIDLIDPDNRYFVQGELSRLLADEMGFDLEYVG